MKRHSALPPNLPPRLLSRAAAAEYVSLSITKFDMLVAEGRMPSPKIIDRRKAWDRLALDAAIDRLEGDGPDPQDDSWSDVDAA